MSKIVWNPAAIHAPLPPALVSCGTMERSNIITIAWTGIINTIPPMTYISVRPERYSYPILCETGEFVINLTTTKLVRAAVFCGARSGAKVDKFAHFSLTKEPCQGVSCPGIGQSPVQIACKIKQRIPLGSHEMFLAEVVSVQVEESLMDEAGKLHLERAMLAAYAHGDYYTLGKRIGSFGFAVKKKKKGGRTDGNERTRAVVSRSAQRK